MTKQRFSTNQLGQRKSFRRYTLAASGALAASGVAGTTQAEIIYSDVPDVTATHGESIFFNMARGTAGTGTPTDEGDQSFNWNTSIAADYSAWRIGNYLEDYGAFINDFPTNAVEFESDPLNPGTVRKKATRKKTTRRSIAGGNSGSNPPHITLARLAEGEPISKSSFGAEVENHFDGEPGGQWEGGGTGFVGLQLTDPADGSSLFGWARVTVDEANDLLTLHEFAYSGDGASILAGQVPEPSSLALLALGAAGVGALRSRSKKRR